MANHRTPLAKAHATGTAKRNPSRFKDRREPTCRPLGKPSTGLTKREVVAWEAFKREAGQWLMEADRSLLEVACQLRAKVWARKAENSDIQLLVRILGRLGMTPVDRTKVFVPPDDPSSETTGRDYLDWQ